MKLLKTENHQNIFSMQTSEDCRPHNTSLVSAAPLMSFIYCEWCSRIKSKSHLITNPVSHSQTPAHWSSGGVSTLTLVGWNWGLDHPRESSEIRLVKSCAMCFVTALCFFYCPILCVASFLPVYFLCLCCSPRFCSWLIRLWGGTSNYPSSRCQLLLRFLSLIAEPPRNWLSSEAFLMS